MFFCFTDISIVQVVLVPVPFCFYDKHSAPCFLVPIVNNYGNHWTYIYI